MRSVGCDPLTGIDYEHRKRWLEQRLQFLARCFAIAVLGFAVLGNHFHVIVRNRRNIVDGWSDREVARRWSMVCSARKAARGQPEEPTEAKLDAIRNDPQRLAEIRLRLRHISWFMGMVAERIHVVPAGCGKSDRAQQHGGYRRLAVQDIPDLHDPEPLVRKPPEIPPRSVPGRIEHLSVVRSGLLFDHESVNQIIVAPVFGRHVLRKRNREA